MKNYKFQVAIAFVCIVLGLMISVQFRTVKQGVGTVSEYRARELAAQLKKLKDERDALLRVKTDYENKIQEYENSASQSSVSAKLIKDELDKARILAGLEDVEGPGIVVTLDDLKFGETTNYALIDDTTLRLVLNELNAAGAEAVSINGQRIISSTEIRWTSGTRININTVACSPPFVFQAIGDPATLEAALRMRDGVVDNIENSGIAVSITKEQLVKIKKFNGVIEKKYSKVVKEGAAN
jgi:uncharacterized protein YlxW (UPF0749 family)